jgi:hypothetical protein
MNQLCPKVSNMGQREPREQLHNSEMTVLEAQRLAAEWGEKVCPHASFETVEDETGAATGRACVQCGSTIDEIVATSSHK